MQAATISPAVFSTTAAQPELGSNGKWAAAFNNWVERGADKYLSSTCASAHVFDTAADADEGGKRAIAYLERTGRFPNMCDKF